MSWNWVILMAIVRVLFVLAPSFIRIKEDFAFEHPKEAQDFARASACKAMLLSFPVLLLINLLATADQSCGQYGVAPYPLTVSYILCTVISVLFLYIPAYSYRGMRNNIFWVVGITFSDAILTIIMIPALVQYLCRQ